jgi:stage III sporulation protein AG
MSIQKYIDYLKSNKKILIILVVGLVFILMGEFSLNEKEESNDFYSFEKVNEKELEKFLSNIAGAGNVKVYITYENNGNTVYATDIKENGDPNKNYETKHIFSDKKPVISGYENPEIKGIAITATGAGNSSVKNRLLKCIKAITGVSYDKISVEMGLK